MGVKRKRATDGTFLLYDVYYPRERRKVAWNFSYLSLSILGKPILAAIKDEQMIVVVTLVYLAIFFSPRDIVYDAVKIVPVYAVICTLKEILRAKKVYKGLAEGREAMPPNGSLLFIPILIAVLKGNGSGFAGKIFLPKKYSLWCSKNCPDVQIQPK